MAVKPLQAYVGALASAAALFLYALDWSVLTAFGRDDWLGLATFVVLAVLSQSLAVDSAVGTAKPVRSSIAFIPLLALAVSFPPVAVVIAAGSMSAFSEIVLRRDRIWHRIVFNFSQTVLSYGLAAWLFHQLTQLITGSPGFSGSDLTTAFFCFYALAVTFFGSNMLFVVAIISLRDRQPLLGVLYETAGRGGGNLAYDLLASPVALLAAYLYANLQFAGLLSVVLPLLLIRHSYLSAIRLHKANRDLLRVLIKAIETRDPYTSGHSLRVSNLAKLIAEDHGLRSGAVSQIETAALLHDIGKIEALYAGIIAKDSSLTEEELKIIQTHATKGADLLQSLTSLEKEVIVGVRHHHERYDGSGYPDGLAGKAIPLAARIIMVCDSVDAMLSDRPYRSALSVDEVRAELNRCAGTQFDPDLIATIIGSNTLERAELLVDRSGARSRLRAVAG
jgi:putative nucleotidyltransferase with HDIG domain